MYFSYSILNNQIKDISIDKTIEDLKNEGYTLTDKKLIIKEHEIIEVPSNYIINNENKKESDYEYEFNEIDIETTPYFINFKKNWKILYKKTIGSENNISQLLEKYYIELFI